MADREKGPPGLTAHHNALNLGLSQTRAPDKRRKEVVDIGIGVEAEGERLHGKMKEYSAWDVYNNEARKVDTKLVNDWRDSLNSLLLFAAIFAAVLTAFIVESKKMLELDPTTVIMEVMIFYTNSVANGTHTPYTPSTFQPESYAVKVNCLFFASLSASLVAALASVVALQWVADYDAAITRGGSSPEERAKRRQFRHAGVVWWKMSEIIASLPLLLYCSVILFFGGLALWMWKVHNVVGLVVIGGAALASLFYVISTFFAVIFVSAPFRTPLGRWIYSSARLCFSSVYRLTRALGLSLIPVWIENKNLTSAMSGRREDLEVEERSEMGMAALVWLANELAVSQDAYHRFLLLVGELAKLKREISLFPGFLDAPWYLIFDLLGWKNLRNTGKLPIIRQDVDAFSILAQCYRIPEINDIISPSPAQYPSPTRPNSLFLLLRGIPLPSTDIEIDIELTIRLSRWRNLLHTSVNTGDVLSPTIAPSIASAALTGESTVKIGTYPKEDDFPLWISRDDTALYTGILRRMVSSLGPNGTMPPRLLDTLRWRFEALLVGTEKVDSTDCLSAPAEYRDALRRSSLSFRSLHYAFTLLLARNLNTLVRDERIFRFKEILIMLWASPVGWKVRRDKNEVGMERFFEANKTLVMGWIWGCQDIPYIHEILGHLSLSQAEVPKIGPLWRVIPPQEGDDPRLAAALSAFDSLITQGAAPEQHCKLIDLVCSDLALGPPEAFEDWFTARRVQFAWINSLSDPCLRLLGQYCVRSREESLYLPYQDINGPLRVSWARIATYFMSHPEGTRSSVILRLQGLLWTVVPNRSHLLSTALRDPGVLRIFEYPVTCSEHCHSEGHLLHLLGDFDVRVHVDLTAYTSIPIWGHNRILNLVLILMLLPDKQYSMSPQNLGFDMHPECLERILEIGKAIRSSQFSSLTVLSEIAAWIIEQDLRGFILCSEELAGMSVGVLRALRLTNDPRVAMVIPDFIYRIRKVKDLMYRRNYRPEENLAADKEATIAANKLMTHLAGMRIFGSQNSQALTCAQNREAHSPAVGWLAMLKD